MTKSIKTLIFVFLISLIVGFMFCQTVRLKDIAKFRGARDNQLFGVGLVVGLNGTGDSTAVPSTLVANMLKNFGMNFSASELKSKNTAIVMVTADIPPFYKEGMRLDVTVSSLGDAKSLSGGVLLQTPMYGADGKVYAVAQGALSIGGEEVGQTANLQKRHQLVAYIPQGAIVEKEIPMEIVSNNSITLMLDRPDFTTAARVAQAINTKFEAPLAKAADAASIKIEIPKVFEDDIITFLAIVEEIEVVPDVPAKIVVNERTGTIVFGGKIRIQDCVISYGNFNVSIKSTEDNTVESLVNALKASGATPQDIVAILQALKRSGALQVELIVM